MEKNKNEINLITINPILLKLHLKQLTYLNNSKDIEATTIYIKETIIPYSKKITDVLFKDLNKLIDEIKNIELIIQTEIEKNNINNQQNDDNDDENRPFDSLDDIFSRFFTSYLFKKDDIKPVVNPDNEVDKYNVLTFEGIKNYLKKMISIIENLDDKYMEIRRNLLDILKIYLDDKSLFIENQRQVLSNRITSFNKLVINQINAQLDNFIQLNNMYLFKYKPNILNFIDLYKKGLLNKQNINALNELEIDTINNWLSN